MVSHMTLYVFQWILNNKERISAPSPPFLDPQLIILFWWPDYHSPPKLCVTLNGVS